MTLSKTGFNSLQTDCVEWMRGYLLEYLTTVIRKRKNDGKNGKLRLVGGGGGGGGRKEEEGGGGDSEMTESAVTAKCPGNI